MSQPSRTVYTASQRTVPDRLMALPPDQTLLSSKNYLLNPSERMITTPKRTLDKFAERSRLAVATDNPLFGEQSLKSSKPHELNRHTAGL